MLKDLKNLVLTSDCDAVSVAVLSFKESKFQLYEYRSEEIDQNKKIYYDLASLSKPLNNSFSIFSENIEDKNLDLLACHKAGLPSWGLLGKNSWREQITSYEIDESETLYSDFSALRYMLEFEKQYKCSLREVVASEFDREIIYWENIKDEYCLQNGMIGTNPRVGVVHDPNAYNLKGNYVNHAGLFGTVEGLSSTLLRFNERYSLCQKMKENPGLSRFFKGFDTVSNPDNTLAGSGCSPKTFGHLGFTGTSFWIDPEKEVGHIILSNATKNYWYNKKELNLFRRKIGKEVWEKFK